MDIFLSDKEIEKTYKMIEEYHRKYLEKYGVHLPSLKEEVNIPKMLWSSYI